ncbi:MAG TPA: hypothetical protein VGS58_14710 [Candidatus Sulfopaludibacter sp.]|nr:hypothetical protein [Candidatus Sulfopaludibacter sp.]
MSRQPSSRNLLLALAAASLISLGIAAAIHREHRVPNVTDSTGAVTLPNGWRITPAGTHVKLPGDLPMKLMPAGDSHLLVLTAGYHDHSRNVIDVRTHTLLSNLDVVKAWDGMAFDAATAFASYVPAGKATRVDPMVALRYE